MILVLINIHFRFQNIFILEEDIIFLGLCFPFPQMTFLVRCTFYMTENCNSIEDKLFIKVNIGKIFDYNHLIIITI